MTYTSLIYQTFGKPDQVLTAVETAYPTISFDQCVVQMILCPINPSDLIPMTGAYAHRIPLPQVAGYEGVGKVIEVGRPIDEHLLGKLVLPLKSNGTWQQVVLAKTADLIILPDFISIEDAAQAYINPITALLLCKSELNLSKGDTLLVNACNSSIGRILIQLSTILGFQLIAVVRNGKYKEELLALGAAFVIATDESQLIEEVMQVTNGQGVSAAIDSIGGIDGTNLAKCVRKQGDFIPIGLLSGQQVDWELIFGLEISARIFHLRHWADRVSNTEWQGAFQQLFGYIKDGNLKLGKLEGVYDFLDYRQALTDALDDRVKGKVFLRFAKE